jgi:RNA polymerase subunit RPABC4/transcription elongation factor Spt4
MFCKSCGYKIDSDSQFCSYCGTKQSETNKPILVNNEAFVQEEAKTVNVNLSFGRQTNSKSNQETNKTYTEPKYDPTYLKEIDATAIGVIILVSSLLLIIFQPFKFDDIDSYNQFRAISSIGALFLRIFITVWVVNIAKRQNRETIGWGLFAFFLPSIALIVIGQQKKIFAKFDIDNSLSNVENSLILTEKAQAFLNANKFNECIRFSEIAIEFDSNNKKASYLLVKARLQIPVNEISNKHTQVVYRETKDKQILKIVSRKYETIGASVFINEVIAPDGEYYYLNDNRKLKVKDGKIEQMTH